ncbi:MAG TPA: histidine phosphatase family protein [Candidatus Limnocylindrales bacterium]
MGHPPRGRSLTAGSDPIAPAGLDAVIVLLRHGESTAIVEGRFQGRSDVPLSPVGRRQAELAAARLARPRATPALPVPVGAPVEIVHSPLARAATTAELVADAAARPDAFGRSIPRRADEGFAEIGQGEWEGLLGAEIAERWSDVLEAWRRAPLEAHAPGGESIRDVEGRVRPALARLLGAMADRAPGAPRSDRRVPGYGDSLTDEPWTILVGHDGVFKVAVLTLLGLPLERFWTLPFALCGISIVELRNGRPTLRAHNLTEHLAPLLEERAVAVSVERERTGAL